MKIHHHTPADRGVTTLMYVGDDDVIDKVTQAPSPKELGVGVVAAIVALQSRGTTRLAAAGIAAFIGYRAYKARG